MPTLITGNQTTSVDISDTTHVIIAAGATLDVAGDAIDFNAGSEPGQVTVDGLVVATADGVDANGDDTILVTQSGTVIATDGTSSDGIRLNNNDNFVRIAGYLYADDFGIISQGNSGNEVVVTQTGVVQGGSDNFGTDGGYSAAIVFQDASATLVNEGTIIGELNPGTGFRVAVADTFSSGGTTPNGLDPSSNQSLTVKNGGDILGDVFLAAGEDTYDARAGGIVEGEIDMGRDDDVAYGALGTDSIRGGNGGDSLSGAGSSDTLRGEGGFDTLRGGAGDDTLDGGNADDLLIGGLDDDRLAGGEGNDTLHGSAGDDRLFGNTGDDFLHGGSGDDQLNGGFLSDTLVGGSGDDLLTGGAAADTFIFAREFGNDVVEDFSDNNNEQLDLTGVVTIVNFADLSNNHLTQTPDGALIDDGLGNTILLEGFNANALDAGDVLN